MDDGYDGECVRMLRDLFRRGEFSDQGVVETAKAFNLSLLDGASRIRVGKLEGTREIGCTRVTPSAASRLQVAQCMPSRRHVLEATCW